MEIPTDILKRNAKTQDANFNGIADLYDFLEDFRVPLVLLILGAAAVTAYITTLFAGAVVAVGGVVALLALTIVVSIGRDAMAERANDADYALYLRENPLVD